MLFESSTSSSQMTVDTIIKEGYASLNAQAFKALCKLEFSRQHEGFSAHWDQLEQDTYMADQGIYRYRRYATLLLNSQTKTFVLQPEQPHYQSKNYNPLNGGIARYFAPVLTKTIQCTTLQALLKGCATLLCQLEPSIKFWRTEMHQFRIVSNPKMIGHPTPEGIHQDGVRYVLITLINRNNLTGGISRIYNLNRTLIHEVTLEEPFESIFLDDTKVLHSVSPITPFQLDNEAYRDVLVLTFNHHF